ncbi:MAG: hypothetical protein ABI230_02725 [Aestuariivirga sp.]
MHDFILHLRLDDVQNLLASGHPPIVLQLGSLLVLWMIIFVFQRIRRRTVVARNTSQAIQWILVVASFAVVCEEQWLPTVQHSESSMYDHISAQLHQ